MSTTTTTRTAKHRAPTTLRSLARDVAIDPHRTGLHAACGAIDEDDSGRRICGLGAGHDITSAHRFVPVAA